jgi:hypothetical protein
MRSLLILLWAVLPLAAYGQLFPPRFAVTGITPSALESCTLGDTCTKTVVITGEGFDTALKGCITTCPGPAVRFGTSFATIVTITDTAVTVIPPVHAAGTVDVSVAGITLFDFVVVKGGFTYLDPAVKVPTLDGGPTVLCAIALALVALLMLRLHPAP